MPLFQPGMLFFAALTFYCNGELHDFKKIDLTEADLPKACNYIAKQFAAHSWWPTEQPGEAKREFELMKDSVTALNVWCERWLDEGQCRKMENELRS
jgi:hypothetical protein